MQVPHDYRITKALHRFWIAHHLAEIHHVVIPARKRRCDHHVAPRQNANVVAIAISELAIFHRATKVFISWHPVSLDVFAGICVFSHTGTSTMVLVVR